MDDSLVVIVLDGGTLKDGGERIYVQADQLDATFAEIGWYALEDALFGNVLATETRPLALADVTSDVDDQFRYYTGRLVDAETGHALTTKPISWDVRWLR